MMPVLGVGPHALTVHMYGAGGGMHQAEQAFDHGGLPRTIGADHRDGLAGFKACIEAAQRPKFAVLLAYVLKYRACHAVFSSRVCHPPAQRGSSRAPSAQPGPAIG